MFIYEAYNKTNGKSYIGLTTKSLEIRKAQHLRSAKSGSLSHFHKALRKHGYDAFEWDIVMMCNNKESLYEKEKLIISLYEPDRLYNKSLGGENPAFGMTHTEETKFICGEYAKQRWLGKRAKDKLPRFIFELPSYREAKKYGVSKTTWYRNRKDLT